VLTREYNKRGGFGNQTTLKLNETKILIYLNLERQHRMDAGRAQINPQQTGPTAVRFNPVRQMNTKEPVSNEKQNNNNIKTPQSTHVEPSPTTDKPAEEERPKKGQQVKWLPRDGKAESEKVDAKESEKLEQLRPKSTRTSRDIKVYEKGIDYLGSYSDNVEGDTKPFASASAKNYIKCKHACIFLLAALCIGFVVLIIAVGIIAAVLLTTRN
jgi:hypothetical protein